MAIALPAAWTTVSNACISTPVMVSIACAAGRQATRYRPEATAGYRGRRQGQARRELTPATRHSANSGSRAGRLSTCTTSIYSGILRMSDLLAQQPNISVPLFLVAPDERRDEVVRQVNRPTFERMNPPPGRRLPGYIIRRAA